MIMASFNPIQNSTTTILPVAIIITFLLHHLLCPVSCFMLPHHAIPPKDPSYEEKNRLGSMPPSCHNKCNQCHPCMAVQVPSLPTHNRVHPAGISPSSQMQGFLLQGNSYSNYKPMSWKCSCGDHFFNP
ncbi:hypothetical protein LR48_Vigan03g307400 [Vigna angularis]|uniref:Epidermal patterning factor-like protein n=1 Tax=Phaseolus angularis TaxID=3914 RepID=A0A0L9UAV6_PHAAN|nr:EPIDERMAL PATTERNING FACTOR-like protein 1 [Vigna angularis]KAG2406799.1 EPIDERMAL PATTERNING FACTOR-like protein [Vigna angularis]KOM39692.1 hypothetical protein LR48_Vigan03g307400 [Vigna angularis]